MNTLTDIISEARNSPETCDKNLLLVINELERVKKDNRRLRAEWLHLHNHDIISAKEIDELEDKLLNERKLAVAYLRDRSDNCGLSGIDASEALFIVANYIENGEHLGQSEQNYV